jgi:hypothetical protein
VSANHFTTAGAFLVSDPTERIAGETPLIEFTVVDNAWNEKRYLPKFITVSCAADSAMGRTARLLRAKEPVTVGGRLDFRTYQDKNGNTRVAFAIDRPTLLVPSADMRERRAAAGVQEEAAPTPEPAAPPEAPRKNAWDA